MICLISLKLINYTYITYILNLLQKIIKFFIFYYFIYLLDLKSVLLILTNCIILKFSLALLYILYY
jgi:hypothetical protein